ncbi:hypothetical protein AsAng_0022790 [Aureispira anguillae]|uniref:Uncharacterized protein n=1 Tax=Aureispira anguillae TaxID=2864201 RepID=A0A915YEH7_9BACT|nr:hypothetical protein AsAng_0022790 [Aureispira anguillae]
MLLVRFIIHHQGCPPRQFFYAFFQFCELYQRAILDARPLCF